MGQRRVPRRHPGRTRRVRRRAGGPARPARRRRRPAGARGADVGLRRQAVPRGVLLLGAPRREPGPGRRGRAGARLRVAGAAARQRPGPRRLHGRLRHPPRPPGHAPALRGRARRRRLARRPRAVRRGRGDPARRPAAQLVRRAAAPLRAAVRAGRPRARGVRPVPLGGDRRAVPRRVGPGPRPRRRRHRDDRAALQVREVLHRAAAAHRRRPRRRRTGHDGAAARRSGCRSARRSSCATTCSASSATRRPPASPRATT